MPAIDTTKSKFGGASLSLTGNEVKNVVYDIRNLSTLTQLGSISFFSAFNYIGIPAENISLVDIYNGTNDNNRIRIYHSSDGKIYFEIYDQTGTKQVNINFAWSSADTNFHHFEINFNLNDGETKAFVDGSQYGSTSSAIATRTSMATGGVYLGSGETSITNCYLDDFVILDEILHFSNFTPRTISFDVAETGLILFARFDTTFNLNVGEYIAPISISPSSNDYGFALYINDVLWEMADIFLTLEPTDEMSDIFNKIALGITHVNPILTEAIAEQLPEGNIRIRTKYEGALIRIEEPSSGRSLLDLLGGVSAPQIPNGPVSDTTIFSLNDGTDNDRIDIIHTTDSSIYLKMYDSAGTIKVNQSCGIWNNENNTWYAFELNFNSSIFQFFLDGSLKSVGITGFTRLSTGNLIVSSGSTNYKFDELIIYNLYKHSGIYSVEDYSLTPYASDSPYADILFGSGFYENEVQGLNIFGSSGLTFAVKMANTWYYYYSGAWRVSNGSLAQTSVASIVESKFKDLYFNENNEITIRIYFTSNGLVEQWLDKIEIIEDKTANHPAIINGTVDLTNPVDLSTNYNVTITTEKGTLEVDLSSAAVDPSAVTLEEIKQAIDDALVPGLAPATDDGAGHLILLTSSGGTDSFISIINGSIDDALAIVFGEETADTGEFVENVFLDYSPLYDWVRRRLGAPLVPVELTDEQLNDCLNDALYWYNYYRNSRENV
jgi:hypothetical protein